MNTKYINLTNRDAFIESNRDFIYKTTYNVCKRSISWQNDDELSIALIAFNKACDTYEDSKGDFFAYCRVIIRNALIDYFRKNGQNPLLSFDDAESIGDYIDSKLSMDQFTLEVENSRRAEEIALFSKELSKYGLDFNVLADCSPSHTDTRNSLLNLAAACSSNESILQTIKTKKLLPIKEICLFTGAKKKTLEKWRRYLLALILILSSDEYPYIKSYLNIKAGE
ncbi:sigma factor [Clostridium thermarum]|uniref:sigma factor n=1 Tax=Clostridium thermarum TaxID=1716543 RepID=UPI00112484F2|nr:sigma factor [Clostridium thermarum]